MRGSGHEHSGLRYLLWRLLRRACAGAARRANGCCATRYRARETRPRRAADADDRRGRWRRRGSPSSDLDRIARDRRPRHVHRRARRRCRGARPGAGVGHGLSVGATSLAVMAHGPTSCSGRRAEAAAGRRRRCAARRGLRAALRRGGAIERRAASAALRPRRRPADRRSGPSIVVGSGARCGRRRGRGDGGEAEARLPDLQPHAALAGAHGGRSRRPSSPLAPLYLRPPDAKPQADKALRERCAMTGAIRLRARQHPVGRARTRRRACRSCTPACSTAWDADSFHGLLEHPAPPSFMAPGRRAARRLAGFILGQLAADEAEILSLGVAHGLAAPRHRPHTGRRPWRAPPGRPRCGGCSSRSRPSNDAALGLYERLGFQEVGRRKGYYQRAGGAGRGRASSSRLTL